MTIPALSWLLGALKTLPVRYILYFKTLIINRRQEERKKRYISLFPPIGEARFDSIPLLTRNYLPLRKEVFVLKRCLFLYGVT